MSDQTNPTELVGPLADERLRFYLRHRRQIEEWASLAKEVRAATVEVFTALAAEIDALAATLGDDVHYEFREDTKFPQHRLYRTSWVGLNGKPIAVIALECATGDVDPTTASAPYAGVLLREPAEGKSVSDSLKASLQTVKPKYKKLSNWWTIHRVLRSSTAEWWADPVTWREWLAEEFEQTWLDLDPIVSNALGARAASVRRGS